MDGRQLIVAKVACIGVGTVGSGWAVVFARAGHTVKLFDTNPEAVSSFALPRIEAATRQLEDANPSGSPVGTILERIVPCKTLAEAVGDTDFVQESAREDLDVKRQLFADIGQLAPKHCLLMSSTSALPGSGFLSDISNPGRALVAHPVNPPSHIPLVELCGTGLTTPASVEKARDFFLAAGMEPIVIRKEIDGFILNRLQYTLVAEAMHLVGEGYCTATDIDRVLTSGLALRWASIGPFMTAHLNARGGFSAFVEQLGPMMRKMGEDARTGYDWRPEMIDDIHAQLAATQPVDTIPEAQAWRDRRILATRRMQAQDSRPDLPAPMGSNPEDRR